MSIWFKSPLAFTTALWALLSLGLWPKGPDQYLEIKWFALYCLAPLSMLATLFLQPKQLPKDRESFFCKKFRRVFIALLAITVTLVVENVVRNWPSFGAESLYQLFCSALLLASIIAVPASFSRKSCFVASALGFAATVCVGIVAAIGLAQASGSELLKLIFGFDFWRNDFPSSTFGFQNITAEYIGLSLIAVVVLVICNPKASLAVSGSAWGIFILGLFYLVILSSRASGLALFISIASLGFLDSYVRRRFCVKRWSVFAATLFACVAIFMHQGKEILSSFRPQGEPVNVSSVQSPVKAFQKHPELLQRLEAVKSTNKKIRIIRWMNTIHMIQANPLGVGINGYPYRYLVYRSSYQSDPEAEGGFMPYNPHNAYLELLVEMGALVFLGVILLMGCLLFGLCRLFADESKDEYGVSSSYGIYSLSLAFFVFLAVDAFFAFPMELPFTQFVATISVWPVLEWVSKGSGLSGQLLKKRLLLPVLIPAFVFGLILSALSSTPIHDWMPQVRGAELVCRMLGEKWENCLLAGKIKRSFGNRQLASDLIETPLQANPYIYPVIEEAILARAELGVDQTNLPRICELAFNYLQVRPSLPQRISFIEAHLDKCD